MNHEMTLYKTMSYRWIGESGESVNRACFCGNPIVIVFERSKKIIIFYYYKRKKKRLNSNNWQSPLGWNWPNLPIYQFTNLPIYQDYHFLLHLQIADIRGKVSKNKKVKQLWKLSPITSKIVLIFALGNQKWWPSRRLNFFSIQWR